jgi:hypothetical protein
MPSPTKYARGVLLIHSAPSVLAAHIEWMLASHVGNPVSLHWEDQPALAGSVRTEANWRAPIGMGAKVASGLLGWRGVRFEITEFGTAESDGSRWLHTPSLGLTHHAIDRAGNTMLNEMQVRDSIEMADGNTADLTRILGRALGEPWDAELDVFRAAAHNETGEIQRLQMTVS